MDVGKHPAMIAFSRIEDAKSGRGTDFWGSGNDPAAKLARLRQQRGRGWRREQTFLEISSASRTYEVLLKQELTIVEGG